MPVRTASFLTAALIGPAGRAAGQQPGWGRGFSALMDSIRVQWKVPGMAVAVAAPGKAIHAAGYGLRDLPNRLPVTPDTRFIIASISKSFTATTLAALARQGKIEWDGQVREYPPDFRMYDPAATGPMTIETW